MHGKTIGAIIFYSIFIATFSHNQTAVISDRDRCIVIIAAAFILHAIVFDVDKARRVAPVSVLVSVACLGVLLFAGVGVANLLYGGRFLEYGVLFHNAAHGNHIGIIIIEIGVGMAVAAVMMIIFFSFARQR